MAYEYKNNEIENNKLLDEIKSKLNASPSNLLDVQLINQITNDLWNKTNRNEDRCISIINKLSNRIKKTQDFKLKSNDFLEKLVQTNKHLNINVNKESENQIIKTEEENDLFKLFSNLVKKNIEISVFLFGVIFLLTIIFLNNFHYKDLKINCINKEIDNEVLFKLDKRNNIIYSRGFGEWFWYCKFNKNKNSCKGPIKDKVSLTGSYPEVFIDNTKIKASDILDLEKNKFYRLIDANEDGIVRAYDYKCTQQ